MSKEKVLLFYLIFLSLPFSCFSQGFRMEAKQLSYRKLIESTQEWSEYTDWEPVNLLMTHDTVKETITIYSKKVQVYKIKSASYEEPDSSGVYSYIFNCTDKFGKKCVIGLVQNVSVSDEAVLYVLIDDLDLMYRIVFPKE